MLCRAASLALAVLSLCVAAQEDDDLLVQDEYFVLPEEAADPLENLNGYERFAQALGADSVRLCNGFPCTGRIDDLWPDGRLKHRGHYDNGKLIAYRNYYPDGTLEREFKPLDDAKCLLRTYHRNGQVRSFTRYAHGFAFEYKDHYVNGQLRYEEERHRSEPYFIRMNLYDANGAPISQLRLVDVRRVIFEQSEHWPGGALKCQGRSAYDPRRMDARRIGTWRYYRPDGTLEREEEYVDGKVHAVR